MLRVRYPVFAMIFGFAFSAYVQRTSVATAAERMMPELGLTQVQVGWMFTAFLFTYAVLQVPGALLGEQWGARRVMALVGLLAVIASLLTAGAPLLATAGVMFATLLFARALLGSAQAAVFPLGAGAIEAWFPVSRWGSMIGLMVTGLWAGAAITSPLVAWLMQHYGWQAALILTSAPSLLLVALWYCYYRDRPPQHRSVKPVELAELAANPPLDPAARLTVARVMRVLGHPEILKITASYLIFGYVFYLVTFWSFLFLVQQRKLTVLESGWLAALPLVVAGVAAALGGRISDRLRVRFGDRVGMRILPLTCLPLAAVFLYLTVSTTSPYWGVAALCAGFACFELCEGNFWGAAMRLAPADSMAATAVLNTGGNIGGVLGTPIIAALSVGQGGWTLVFVTGAVTALASAFLWLTIDAGRGSTKHA